MRLANTLTRSLAELPPPTGPGGGPTRIGMYFCGPTVYARIHVGNARPFVISMWLRAWLKERGYAPHLVINITDVNDKIYDAAPGDSARLAAEASQWYIDDTSLLGLGRPDEEPKATETVPEIIALIEDLVERDMAYEAGGDVYFRVAQFPGYGCLSGQRLEEMQDTEPNPLKHDPRDFALWKATKPGEDTSWESPWGMGRPGWHIECSAMAEKYLGPEFEIHGGGIDLAFPHHENELAQSRAAGREFAKVWMHNGMLRFTGEKMSKSLGNTALLRPVVEEWGRETVLLFFMTGHWSKPIDFSPETLAQAKAQVESFRNAFRFGVEKPRIGVAKTWSDFEAALDDDFNTPAALAVMHSWRSSGMTDELTRALRIFGLDSLAEGTIDTAGIETILRNRDAARAARDFETADRLRGDLWRLRYSVIDTPEGQKVLEYSGVTPMGNAGNDPEAMRLAEEFEEARWTGDRLRAKSLRMSLQDRGFSIEELPTGAVVARLGRT